VLDATLLSTYRAGYELVIETLGTPATWTQAKPPHATKSVTAGLKIAGNEDDALVQAYGVGARVITVKAKDFTAAPEKFDRVTMGSETMTIEAVHPVHLNAALVGYKLYVRGK